MRWLEQTRFGGSLLVLAVLFLALVMATGVLLRGARVDLTQNQLYTLSDGTREILTSLDEPINLHFFYSDSASESLPRLRDYARRVREMLREVEMRAGGAIRLREIDPVPFSDAEDRARLYGLQGVPIGSTGETLYFGLVGTNALDERVLIPFFQPDKELFLEYDLAQLIFTLSQGDKPLVALHSELPMSGQALMGAGEPWMMLEQMQELFDLTELDDTALAEPDALADVDLLVLVHPRQLDDMAQYRIDQFLLGGGRLMVFVDPMAEADITASQMGIGAASSLPLLDRWGIGFDAEQVVLDRQLAMSVSGEDGRAVSHPAILSLGQDQLSQTDIITAQLDQVVVSSAGALTLAPDSAFDKVALISSSADSRLQEAQRVALATDLRGLLLGFEADAQEHVLAARFTGQPASAFQVDDLPEGASVETHLGRAESDVTLIVFADTDLLSDRLWVDTRQFFGQRMAQAWANNGDLVINAMDNLTGSSALMSIRTRASSQRPFERIEAMRREAGQRLLDAEAELERDLAETERRLADLQQAHDETGQLTMSEEQSREIERFQQRQMELRQQLRQVRRELDADIEAMATRLKLINIFAVPALLALLGTLVMWRRYRRGGGR